MRKNPGILLLFAVGGAALFAADAKAPQKKAAPARPVMPPSTVLIGEAVKIKDASAKKYVGALKAVYDVGLPARISGVIMEQKVNHGDFVEKGQLLFVLEDTTYRAAVDSARAQVAQCEAEFRYSKSNFERNDRLHKQKAVSESAYEEATRLYAANTAKLAAAKAALLDAENNLSYTRIHSPIKGRIGKCTYSPSNFVTPSSGVLATVVSIDPVNVDFSISERDYLSLFGSIDAVKRDALVKLQLADGTTYPTEGTIVFVDNKIDPDTDTVLIRAEFKNPDYKLIPGGLVTVMLSHRLGGELAAVPLPALLIDAKGPYVYVLDKENRVVRRDVVIGSEIGGLQSIRRGLKPGETIVVDGTHKARPGEVVTPIRRGGGKAAGNAGEKK